MIFYDPNPVILNALGEAPNALGSLAFFDSGLNTLKAIYSDSTLSVPLPNPLTLGADGRITAGNGAWYGVGSYRIRCYNANGAELWMRDGVESFTASHSGSDDTVETMEDLRALAPNSYALVSVIGYWSAGDGGGGLWRWQAGSVDADDGGSVVQPDAGGAGRWKRLIGAEVQAAWWGAIPGIANAETYLGRARDYCISYGKTLILGAGQLTIGGDIDLSGAYSLRVLQLASFASVAAQNVTLGADVIDIQTKSTIAGANITLTVAATIGCRPEWWGITGAVGEVYLWQEFSAGRSDGNTILSGNYEIDDGLLTTLGFIHFETGAKLTIGAPVSITGISYETPGDWLIYIKSGLDVLITNQNEWEAWVFFGITSIVDTVSYERVVKNLTNSGTKYATLVWNTLSEYEIKNTPAWYVFVTNKIEAGTNLKSGGVYSIGNIVAGNYQIFSMPCVGPFVSQPAPLEWWGAVSGDSSIDNGSALSAAAYFAPSIDGIGTAQAYLATGFGGYYIDSSVLPQRLSASGLCLRNNSTGFVGITTDAVWSLDKCAIIGLIGPQTLLTVANSIEFSNCFLQGSFDAFIAAKITLNANNIDAEIILKSVGSPSSVSVSSNRMKSLMVDGSLARITGMVCNNIIDGISGVDSDWKLSVLYGDNMSIIGNCGNGSNNMLFVDFCSGCTISNNTFKDLRIGDADEDNTNCCIIGNVSTSASAVNVMGGTNCTVIGNTNLFGAGSYYFTPATNVAYNV